MGDTYAFEHRFTNHSAEKHSETEASHRMLDDVLPKSRAMQKHVPDGPRVDRGPAPEHSTPRSERADLEKTLAADGIKPYGEEKAELSKVPELEKERHSTIVQFEETRIDAIKSTIYEDEREGRNPDPSLLPLLQLCEQQYELQRDDKIPPEQKNADLRILGREITGLFNKDSSLSRQLRDNKTFGPEFTRENDKIIELNQQIEGIEYEQHLLEKGDNFDSDLRTIDQKIKDPAKLASVYAALEKIADDKSGRLSHFQKQELLEQLAHQIAHPEDIKQGDRGSCALASTEFEMASHYPDKYASDVADLATTGKALISGKAGDPNAEYLSLDWNPLNNADGKFNDDEDSQRSLASRLFQDATANKFAQDKYGPGARYYDCPPYWTGFDSQGRPVQANEEGGLVHKPDGSTVFWPGLTAQDQAKLMTDLTGDTYKAERITGNLSDPGALVQELQESGFPVVFTMNPVPGDFTGMPAGGHAMTITGIEQVDGVTYVDYDNTANSDGRSARRVTLSNFMQTVADSDGYLLLRTN